MVPEPKTRREFLKTAGIGLATASVARASSYSRILGANDRVRVGVVGFSDRFRSSLLRQPARPAGVLPQRSRERRPLNASPFHRT